MIMVIRIKKVLFPILEIVIVSAAKNVFILKGNISEYTFFTTEIDFRYML